MTGLRKFGSRNHRHVEALAAVSLRNDAGEEVRRIMLSAGGKGSGSDWIAVPTSWNDWWDEVSNAPEIGFFENAGCCPCRFVNKSTGEPCGHLMRGIVTHSQVCRCGPARQRGHGLKRMMAAELICTSRLISREWCRRSPRLRVMRLWILLLSLPTASRGSLWTRCERYTPRDARKPL